MGNSHREWQRGSKSEKGKGKMGRGNEKRDGKDREREREAKNMTKQQSPVRYDFGRRLGR